MRTWNLDEPSCELRWDDGTVPVRFRADVADEPYRAHTPQREFVPLSVASGIRTRIIGQPYLRDRDGVVRRIGEAEAYFYHEDAVLLLWRCRLLEPFRAADPAADRNLHVLWESFEHLLAVHFPLARATVTPAWSRPYPSEQWRAFLVIHGFARPSPTGIPGMAFIRP